MKPRFTALDTLYWRDVLDERLQLERIVRKQQHYVSIEGTRVTEQRRIGQRGNQELKMLAVLTAAREWERAIDHRQRYYA